MYTSLYTCTYSKQRNCDDAGNFENIYFIEVELTIYSRSNFRSKNLELKLLPSDLISHLIIHNFHFKFIFFLFAFHFSEF